MTEQLDEMQLKTDNLGRLMSKTMQSLAADATAVRQLTSIAKLGGLISDENVNPNFDGASLDPFEGLREIDMAVASMEKKVEALRSIVVEEKRALDQFESTLQAEANAQRDVISNMLVACKTYNSLWQEKHTPQKVSKGAKDITAASSKIENEFESKSLGTLSVGSTNLSATKNRRRRDSLDPRSHNPATNIRDNHEQQEAHVDEHPGSDNASDTDTTATQATYADFKFDPVSEAELSTISRNSRGRVTTMALNEALEEIESVCRNNFHILARIGNQRKSVPGQTANSLERRFEYLKQQRANLELEVGAHSGHQWVSEQELRENCPFFRWGEGTARATLSVLCSLKRLKQIPGKNLGVTYICIPSSDQPGNY